MVEEEKIPVFLIPQTSGHHSSFLPRNRNPRIIAPFPGEVEHFSALRIQHVKTWLSLSGIDRILYDHPDSRGYRN